ncbi:citrate synthase [Nannocystis sp. ILAH1]|uniref:citrate synthase n=1 Tax=unclassified Nannocystis TaxID=2627009 RepID=UPI002270E087|nr:MULTISPECIES: citrate synthase [unclassified Nannocystis]MCY0989289.1 citrate synthase [Nannocystis sp. ILAH1]MCY1065016.1 citrate synthase [Nannocystis sp. RBIL2]
MDTTVTRSGLDGVVVADTRLSEVDGERGRLVLAGHDIERLAGGTSFEALAGLLWTGALPQAAAADATRQALAEGRVRAFARLHADELGRFADGMDALRAAMARLSADDGFDAPANLTGAVAVFAAAWARVRAGGQPLAPDPALPHAADYLRMLTGEAPDPARVAALEAYLVTVADHGMNASTFAARVVASTGSDAVSAIVAAIGALKGPLHGGAPGPVLDMLDAIGEPAGAARWIEAELAAGRRIMGMGHRIYRVRDPRAAVLEAALARLEQAGVSNGRLALARAVERAAEGALRAKYPDRPLAANVEFYTAVLLDAVGLDRAAFSPTFAAGRVAGWCAHVLEQSATGRLIRPASRYVGPAPLQ